MSHKILAQKNAGPIKVLYIGGMGRSGSTLLGRLLGSVPGYVNVGELYLIWQRWSSDSIRCGCGEVFSQCEFWREVFESAFGTPDPGRLARILEIQQRLLRPQTLPRLLLGRGQPYGNEAGDEYREDMARLYRAIAAVTGARVIVDTSKFAAYAYLLDGIPELDLRFVHLVRDSRAVAFSQGRRKLNTAFVDKKTYMTPCSWQTSVKQWTLQNLIIHLRRPGRRFLRMRYEDLVSNPRAMLPKVFTLLDEPLPDLDFLDSPLLRVTDDHTVSGNPIRFQRELEIRPDLEWRARMPLRLKALVTAATFPLLARYGYLRGADPTDMR
jgi:hypothetical protein